ncbi:endonuclease/exonuclease/phosphatase family protein [Kitasatospora sp. NPDC097691]|uniref:endonuclease/exonuclease/phosphatase family protein n=1 Tax=Kitasatospora sp. NPDC097691 TaxID=3157231 RepID=UPI00331D33C4
MPTALYTRLPVSSAADPAWPTTNLTVDVGGHPVQLAAVHTCYPAGGTRRWAEDLHGLRAAATGRTRNTVMLGDFNATLDHRPMRDLVDTGLADTHEELGAGLFPTWPQDHPDYRVPAVIQIDHVLHGPALEGRAAFVEVETFTSGPTVRLFAPLSVRRRSRIWSVPEMSTP